MNPALEGDLLRGMLASPFLGCSDGLRFVLLPMFGNIVGKRIVWVGCAEEGLDWEQDSSDLKSRRPLILENVEANSAELVDIGMINLGQEADLGRSHRIIIGQEQLQLEDTICK
jgi:hypothetical protein